MPYVSEKAVEWAKSRSAEIARRHIAKIIGHERMAKLLKENRAFPVMDARPCGAYYFHQDLKCKGEQWLLYVGIDNGLWNCFECSGHEDEERELRKAEITRIKANKALEKEIDEVPF